MKPWPIPLYFLLTSSLLAAALPNHPLLQQAQQQRAPRVRYALENNARIELTQDGKSYYVLWLPPNANPSNPPPIIVSIHGHDGWAVEDFYHWHDAAKKSGFGVLALQWWLGQGEAPSDYLTPREMFNDIDNVLQKIHAQPQRLLLHGFSRGSANIYALAALDRQSQRNYFSLIVANAGKPNPNYGPIREIENGKFGPNPFSDTHWVTFAGGQDKNPDRDGVPGMREAADWIRKLGGTVDLMIEDPDSDHGGFHRNPKNTEAALDIFQRRLAP